MEPPDTTVAKASAGRMRDDNEAPPARIELVADIAPDMAVIALPVGLEVARPRVETACEESIPECAGFLAPDKNRDIARAR